MKYSLIILFAIVSVIGYGQKQGSGGLPKSLKYEQLFKNIDKRTFDVPNIDALRAEDELTDHTGTGPWRFGFNNYTSLTLLNSGSWFELENGGRIWFLKLTCEQALTINLSFINSEIPDGNELFVFNESRDFILGKFEQEHLYNGQLGVELVPGSTVIVEYFVKKDNPNGSLEISTVTHGYRTADEFQEKAFGSSGACNMNVNCPDGLPWQPERNSALMLVSGSNGFCSGAL
ncbi:MAG: hypothetical protein FJX84_05110, partial [Bacteroidetes bacterium]|nr:hypothetical protein [Bacteroidota bacterium]